MLLIVTYTCICYIAANQSELIFIFFDPIGQALCKRTMDLIEILSKNKSDRMEYFLSKSDEAGNEIDRQVRTIVVHVTCNVSKVKYVACVIGL